MPEQPHLTYTDTGVDYAAMDPFKVAAQQAAAGTAGNLRQFGMHEVRESRGESAYVWAGADRYHAMVTEGLGTKNLVADAVRPLTGRSHYDQIAQDTVAMIVNDLIVVGASPTVVSAHFSVGDSAWFEDRERAQDLLNGWADACNQAGATWGGGETPTLKGVLLPGIIELSGSAVGEIYPAERLTLGERLQPTDAIVLIGGTGIHANGLTMARTVAEQAPDGYSSPLPDNTTYGEALLKPTPIYISAVQGLFDAGVDIHYMANITGHGWRKLMRAAAGFTYRMTELPPVQPVFDFIQQQTHASAAEMYATFNMGAGFAVYIERSHAEQAVGTLHELGYAAVIGGCVEAGERQVIIEPLGITYDNTRLTLR